jgi:hypothetical protein
MGAELTCTARFNGKSAAGKARLETAVLEFRGGDLKLSIPFVEVTRAGAKDGTLRVSFAGGVASFDVGAAAAKWAQRILHPPSRLQKIGVKAAWRVSAIHIDSDEFLQELTAAVGEVVVGRAAKASDAIFFGATREADLGALDRLKSSLKPDGALWIVRPKGRPEISEAAVMRAGKAAGLVDVKVVSFSPTHTAEKFVIPVANRR